MMSLNLSKSMQMSMLKQAATTHLIKPKKLAKRTNESQKTTRHILTNLTMLNILRCLLWFLNTNLSFSKQLEQFDASARPNTHEHKLKDDETEVMNLNKQEAKFDMKLEKKDVVVSKQTESWCKTSCSR